MSNQKTVAVGFEDQDVNNFEYCAKADVGMERMTAIAQERLSSSNYGDIRSLSCKHHEGIIVIRGRVANYYHKQLAQEAIRGLDGVEVIVNAVEVRG